MQILYIRLLFFYSSDPVNMEDIQTSFAGKNFADNAEKSIVLEFAGILVYIYNMVLDFIYNFRL